MNGVLVMEDYMDTMVTISLGLWLLAALLVGCAGLLVWVRCRRRRMAPYAMRYGACQYYGTFRPNARREKS